MTVFFIRHASAGRRGFDADDDHRPLDEHGHAQAHHLAALLRGRGIEEIHSSAATRCLQSVGPLSRAIGVPIEPAGELLEGSSVGRVLDFVRSFAGRNVALCSHGDIIPEAIRALEVGGTRIEGERRCAKGSIWELTFDDDGRITTAGYAAVEPTLDPVVVIDAERAAS